MANKGYPAESARAAALASHSAAGLAASGGQREAARLLRAAEALARAAVAQLLAPRASGLSASAPVAMGAAAGVPLVQDKGQKVTKKKKKRKKVAVKDTDKEELQGGGDVDMPAAVLDASLSLAAPGGSVVVGDLSELGVPGGHALVVRPSAMDAASTLVPLRPSSCSPLASTPAVGSGVAADAGVAGSGSAGATSAAALVAEKAVRGMLGQLTVEELRKICVAKSVSAKGARAALETRLVAVSSCTSELPPRK